MCPIWCFSWKIALPVSSLALFRGSASGIASEVLEARWGPRALLKTCFVWVFSKGDNGSPSRGSARGHPKERNITIRGPRLAIVGLVRRWVWVWSGGFLRYPGVWLSGTYFFVWIFLSRADPHSAGQKVSKQIRNSDGAVTVARLLLKSRAVVFTPLSLR